MPVNEYPARLYYEGELTGPGSSRVQGNLQNNNRTRLESNLIYSSRFSH